MPSLGGLSPRVRGNRRMPRCRRGCSRSIPACAGEPNAETAVIAHVGVYPRVCGGTRPLSARAAAAAGLSPRVWGNRIPTRPYRTRRRSIPACAGEPGLSAAGLLVIRVYPRVCGGTPLSPPPITQSGGLSPRVRGNRHIPAPILTASRSIPACAGEPIWALMSAQPLRVYPRVCGGTGSARSTKQPRWGLSPRVRGNRAARRVRATQRGSIPACAGEPSPVRQRTRAKRVYPRVCGGTRRRPTTCCWYGGLSPRVRGNRRSSANVAPTAGSIPACAGEPAPATAGAFPISVYPRVCGGTRE